MKNLNVIKVGGHVLENPSSLANVLDAVTQMEGAVIVVHGGGKMAGQLAEKLGIEQTVIHGRRVTDAETLDVAIMVYAGLVNKRVVAGLQLRNFNAIGLTGADLNVLRSVRRPEGVIDFGFVGDPSPEHVNVNILETLLNLSLVPVLSPLTWDGESQLLNTNADTIASVIAIAMSDKYKVNLFYCFEKKGVLLDANDDASVIKVIGPDDCLLLQNSGVLKDGILPKLENAFKASRANVEVRICSHEDLTSNKSAQIGTLVCV